MIKIFKKYKYTSLVVGALTIAIASGVSWSYTDVGQKEKTQIEKEGIFCVGASGMNVSSACYGDENTRHVSGQELLEIFRAKLRQG